MKLMSDSQPLCPSTVTVQLPCVLPLRSTTQWARSEHSRLHLQVPLRAALGTAVLLAAMAATSVPKLTR